MTQRDITAGVLPWNTLGLQELFHLISRADTVPQKRPYAANVRPTNRGAHTSSFITFLWHPTDRRKTHFNLIHECWYINKFIVFPVSSTIVSYLPPVSIIISFPSGVNEVSVTLNRAEISFGSCRESLWLRCLLWLFVWPVGSHLVWIMAAVRVPLASVTPTMAAWSHVA